MPKLVEAGKVYLAMPPLYRISHGSKSFYARDDAHKEEILRTEFRANAKVEIGRFKGLGEMMPAQLKETTMNPVTRTLARLQIAKEDEEMVSDLVETLMGKKAELRFNWITQNAKYAEEIDI